MGDPAAAAAAQFYITLRDGLDFLDGKHTVFGEVVEGLEVLDKVNEAYLDDSHRPIVDIRVKHTYVLLDPFPVRVAAPRARVCVPRDRER